MTIPDHLKGSLRFLILFCRGGHTGAHLAVLITSLLFAPLGYGQVCNVVPSGDDIGIPINNCVVTLGSAGGAIIIPAQTQPPFTVNTQILLASNITLQGAGMDATILQAGSRLGEKQVIRILGTQSAPVQNAKVKDLQVQNGTPSTLGFTMGMDGIRADHCQNCTFENLNVNSIQGEFGIVVKYCSYCYILDNSVANFTYAGITALNGGDHIYILRNTIQGATVASGLAYGIGASGYEQEREANYNNYVWVDHNQVSDIPTWECYDTHGGQHQWFTNNICINARYGVAAGLAVNGATNPVADDFHILYNTSTSSIYSETNTNYGNRSCMPISSDSIAIPVTHVDVEWNTCSGFGSSATSGAAEFEAGGILSIVVRYFKYENNTCLDWYQSCIDMWLSNQHGTVSNNAAMDMRGQNNNQSSQIYFPSSGNYDIAVSGNQLNPADVLHAPEFQIWEGNAHNQVTLGTGNIFRYVGSSQFSSYYYFPFNVPDPAATGLTGERGDMIYSATSGQGWVVTGPLLGFGSEDTTSIQATGQMAAGEAAITNLSSSTGCQLGKSEYWYYCLPEGMNITIAGAGPAGGALNARILNVASSNGTTLDTIVLDTPAAMSVTSASITYQPMTVTPIIVAH